ncbi:MAG: hypothetical protein A2X59_12400, partial [Nitrospirae bacterium GWC2_42_7]
VYLRQLYYPSGFVFPLTTVVLKSLWIEYLREMATIAMLASIAMLSGKNRLERIAAFLFSFGMWDIFYYLWLKVLIDWPSSLFTWDVLFLIPVVWVAPVLAPIICAVTMIAMALLLLKVRQKNKIIVFRKTEILLWVSGCSAILFTFMIDYMKLFRAEGFPEFPMSLFKNPRLLEAISQYVPASYHWELFAFGEIAVVCGLLFFLKRYVL